jgi:hypothetical protein
VGAQLVALIKRELIRPDPDGPQRFACRHPLVRDAVYASVPKQVRADLHERLARVASADGEVADFHRARAERLREELGLPLADD